VQTVQKQCVLVLMSNLQCFVRFSSCLSLVDCNVCRDVPTDTNKVIIIMDSICKARISECHRAGS